MSGIAHIAAALAVFAAGCARQTDTGKPTLTVFVATSMAEIVAELTKAFSAGTGIPVETSAAATGVLRRQIEAGAACDVFIAADDVEMERLIAGGFARPKTRVVLTANELVVVVHQDNPQWAWTRFADVAAPDVGRVAIGDPAYVPAGRYAQRTLEAAGAWGALEERLILADNVRVACQYVRTGQADVAIVYATDAALLPDLRIVWRLDAHTTGPVVCPAAVCTQAHAPEQAEALLAFLAAPQQDTAWTKRGFQRRR